MKKHQIPVYIPLITKNEAKAVSRVLKTRWVTQGPEVAQFEDEFATFVGSKFACATSNCTTALHLALLAIGVKKGDEVITVSHSFIATANAIKHCGANPVFIDIEADTFNINPDLIHNAVTKKTKAILVVHQMGMPCDLKTILNYAKKAKLRVIEDAACAVGSEIKLNDRWEKIGKSQTDLACFSFHPRKLLTTGEGGMVTTNNSEFDRKLRLLRHHGMSVSDVKRHTAKTVVFEEYTEVGFNYRMSDIHAAVGRVQLKLLPQILLKRREQVALYNELLSDIPGLVLPSEPSWAKSNWQSFCVRLPDYVDQKALMQLALKNGIALRRGVMCAHREKAYKNKAKYELPESEKAQDQSVLLPLFHEMSTKDQKRVAEFLRKTFERWKK